MIIDTDLFLWGFCGILLGLHLNQSNAIDRLNRKARQFEEMQAHNLGALRAVQTALRCSNLHPAQRFEVDQKVAELERLLKQ